MGIKKPLPGAVSISNAFTIYAVSFVEPFSLYAVGFKSTFSSTIPSFRVLHLIIPSAMINHGRRCITFRLFTLHWFCPYQLPPTPYFRQLLFMLTDYGVRFRRLFTYTFD